MLVAREVGVQSQVESYQRLKTSYLIHPFLALSIIKYVSRVKWINLGKRMELSLQIGVVTVEKTSFGSLSTMVVSNLYTTNVNLYIYIYIYMCVCVCVCGCINNIQSASQDYGCGLFVYRIYEGFHINLREYSMYGYCCVFLFRFI